MSRVTYTGQWLSTGTLNCLSNNVNGRNDVRYDYCCKLIGRQSAFTFLPRAAYTGLLTILSNSIADINTDTFVPILFVKSIDDTDREVFYLLLYSVSKSIQ